MSELAIVTELEKETRAEVAVYVEPIRSFLVVDDNTMQRAGDTIKEINKQMKVVDEKFADVMTATVEAKRKATEAKSALDRLIEEIKAPLVSVKDYLVSEGKKYQVAVQKRMDDERRRLAELARKEAEERLLREAEEAEKAGAHEEAEAIIQEPIYVPPPVVPGPSFKVDNRSFQKRWKGRGVDKLKAIRFIAANPTFISLLTFDDVAINNMARSIRGQSPVPGIDFYEE